MTIPVDYECTAWPDIWFGISLAKCCIDHDLGGTDWELFMCVSSQHWAFLPLGAVMLFGVTALKPLYKAWRKYNGNNKSNDA